MTISESSLLYGFASFLLLHLPLLFLHGNHQCALAQAALQGEWVRMIWVRGLGEREVITRWQLWPKHKFNRRSSSFALRRFGLTCFVLKICSPRKENKKKNNNIQKRSESVRIARAASHGFIREYPEEEYEDNTHLLDNCRISQLINTWISSQKILKWIITSVYTHQAMVSWWSFFAFFLSDLRSLPIS